VSDGSPVFAFLKDRQLLKLGVPEELLDKIRQITTESQLNKLEAILPEDAYEGLFLCMAEPSIETYEEILTEREVDELNNYDDSNFAKALERLNSRAEFVVAHDEKELTEVLSAGLEKWRVFLHPSQSKLAQGIKSGAVRVLGGAGTGKTVVAMHRARWLAANVATPNNKVLFTTFTKNLAIDIENNLRNICTMEEFSLIEVINLDQWVQAYMRENVSKHRLMLDSDILNAYWKNALFEKPEGIDLSSSFFKEEWQRVVQPNGIQDANGYKTVSRVGRGTKLDRKQRLAIWPVFESYRRQLDANGQKELDDCYRNVREYLISNDIELPYCGVVIDEAQDMGTQAFLLLRKMVNEGPNDLFIVGDAHQRIYGRNKVVLGQCGINIRGRSKKLHINYRTTDETRSWASNLLAGRQIDDLDGGEDSNKGYRSLTHGLPPLIEQFTTELEQAEFIKALLMKSTTPISHICVVARTNKEVESIQTLLNNSGIETVVIKSNEVEVSKENAVRLASIHRIKGLEFDELILASANDGLVPLSFLINDKADQASKEQAETEERSLVYVALTRARKQAYVLSYGKISSFFRIE
jgi:superfamily I DNA/RNA helicase